MVLEIFGVGKWDSDFWESDGDLNADVLEDETILTVLIAGLIR